MSVDAYEMYNSRSTSLAFQKQSAKLELFCKGTYDDTLARAALLSITPDAFNFLLFENLDVESVGGGIWLGHASYSSTVTPENPGQGGASPPPPPPPRPGDNDPLGPGFSFDISVQSEKITQAKEVIQSKRRNGGVAPDSKGAINVTATGEVEGCERLSPKMEFTITKTMGFVTLNYVSTLYHLVGKTNNDSFYGFPRGEVLSIGVSGQGKDIDKVEMSFKYAVSPNETGITITP